MIRPIHSTQFEELPYVLILTRSAVRQVWHFVTVAPISEQIIGLSTEIRLATQNGLPKPSVAKIDELITFPISQLGPRVGYLLPQQEAQLARAMVFAFDLDLPIFANNPIGLKSI